jgi:thymidylate synthase
MPQADKEYDKIIHQIMMEGVWDRGEPVRTKWSDCTPAYTQSILNAQMHFDGTEVPILTRKKVAERTATKEMLLFWQMKTNRAEDFHNMGVTIWDEWIKEDGTIGPAYGAQLGKPCRVVPKSQYDITLHDPKKEIIEFDVNNWLIDQVDYLIWQLKTNPTSRRHIVSLWNITDLDEMALTPCVWNSQWIVQNRKLHLIVGVRSNDMALGNPFNVYQYYVLQRMMAQVCKYDIGTLTFNINNAHIYERHVNGLEEQMRNQEFPAPTLWLNPNITNFYDFTMDDIKLFDYISGPTIPFEVAI